MDTHRTVYCTVSLPVCLTLMSILAIYILRSIIALSWPQLCFYVL